MTPAWERELIAIVRAIDPVEALRRAIAEPTTPVVHRDRLRAIEPEGLRLAALLVLRLRFERLLAGSRLAAEWFELHPRAFARAFRRYHAEVEAGAYFPADEGAAFERWAAAHDLAPRTPGCER